jgi:hypothetical protein
LKVKFGKQVDAADHAQLEAHANHWYAGLDASHPAKAATHANIWKGYHTEGSTDTLPHATADFYNGNFKSKNWVGTHHLYEHEAP